MQLPLGQGSKDMARRATRRKKCDEIKENILCAAGASCSRRQEEKIELVFGLKMRCSKMMKNRTQLFEWICARQRKKRLFVNRTRLERMELHYLQHCCWRCGIDSIFVRHCKKISTKRPLSDLFKREWNLLLRFSSRILNNHHSNIQFTWLMCNRFTCDSLIFVCARNRLNERSREICVPITLTRVRSFHWALFVHSFVRSFENSKFQCERPKSSATWVRRKNIISIFLPGRKYVSQIKINIFFDVCNF